MFGKNRVSTGVPKNPSHINKDVRIRGALSVSEPLFMEGQLDGDIDADTLHFASLAVVTGEVTAQSVTIDGKVLGSNVIDRVYLSATAHFEGQMHCQDVAVKDDANVNAKFTKEPVING